MSVVTGRYCGVSVGSVWVWFGMGVMTADGDLGTELFGL